MSYLSIVNAKNYVFNFRMFSHALNTDITHNVCTQIPLYTTTTPNT